MDIELKKVTDKDIKDGIFVMPDCITEICYGAFYNCSSLKKIIISPNVEVIGGYAFSGCDSLENVDIPNSVTSIGGYAFSDCRSLKNVNMSKNLNAMGRNVFSYSDNLKNINLYTYKSFNAMFKHEQCHIKLLRLIAITSFIKNYYNGLIKYSEEDINLFKQDIYDYKNRIINYIFIEKEDVELVHIVLFKMELVTYEKTCELINECKNPEIMAMLLEYSHHFNVNPFDKLNLEEISKQHCNFEVPSMNIGYGLNDLKLISKQPKIMKKIKN